MSTTKKKRPEGFAGQVAKLRDRLDALEARVTEVEVDLIEETGKLEARAEVHEMALAWLKDRVERR